MELKHYIQKGIDGAHDIDTIRIDLFGEDMAKLFTGDMPMLSVCNADGEVIQQISVTVKKIETQMKRR